MIEENKYYLFFCFEQPSCQSATDIAMAYWISRCPLPPLPLPSLPSSVDQSAVYYTFSNQGWGDLQNLEFGDLILRWVLAKMKC